MAIIDIRQNTNFQPITVTIKIETIEELCALAAAFNVSIPTLESQKNINVAVDKKLTYELWDGLLPYMKSTGKYYNKI